MRYFLLAMVLLLIPLSTNATIRPNDFAYGRPLVLKENGAVYRIDVPLEVYKTLSTSDMSDIAIFNGAEVAVPHIIRLPKTKTGISETTKPLPFFPLYQVENATDKNGLSVRINKREDGTIISIDSDDNGAVNGKRFSGYLIDISKHTSPIDALDFTWPANTEDFTTDVTLEYSNDLTKWETLVPRSTIVLMRFNGQEIVRKRIENPGHAIAPRIIAGAALPSMDDRTKGKPKVKLVARYLRLRWLSGSNGPELKEVLAVQQIGEPQRKRIWTTIDRMPEGNDSNNKITAFEYDSAARLPVDQIRIGFAEKNTLAKVKVFSRPDLESKWRFRQSSVLYNLEFDKTSLIQDTIHTGPASDRYWRLEIEGSKSGSLGKAPVVKLGWLPHELLFVAQGEGPFVFAYGSARLGEKASEANPPELLSRIIGKNENALVKNAYLSGKITLGGPDLLVPIPSPLPWRDWILWCVLILGVGIIAKMAFSLLKGMDKNQ